MFIPILVFIYLVTAALANGSALPLQPATSRDALFMLKPNPPNQIRRVFFGNGHLRKGFLITAPKQIFAGKCACVGEHRHVGDVFAPGFEHWNGGSADNFVALSGPFDTTRDVPADQTQGRLPPPLLSRSQDKATCTCDNCPLVRGAIIKN